MAGGIGLAGLPVNETSRCPILVSTAKLESFTVQSTEHVVLISVPCASAVAGIIIASVLQGRRGRSLCARRRRGPPSTLGSETGLGFEASAILSKADNILKELLGWQQDVEAQTQTQAPTIPKPTRHNPSDRLLSESSTLIDTSAVMPLAHSAGSR